MQKFRSDIPVKLMAAMVVGCALFSVLFVLGEQFSARVKQRVQCAAVDNVSDECRRNK